MDELFDLYLCVRKMVEASGGKGKKTTIDRHTCPWFQAPSCEQCRLRDMVYHVAGVLGKARSEDLDSHIVVRFLTEGADAAQRRLERAVASTSKATQATWTHAKRAIAMVVLGNGVGGACSEARITHTALWRRWRRSGIGCGV